MQIITYPSHATRVCPKCDVNELEVSSLAHILLEHCNARFSELDLLGALLNSDHNQVLPDSTSSVDEVHDRCFQFELYITLMITLTQTLLITF